LRGLQIIKPPSVHPCYLVSLRPKWRLSATFLTQCERPSFTPTWNSRQNYSSV
jgi:hypothetical protein